MGFDDNHSYTHHRTKGVDNWINSSPLRASWWGRACPICGDKTLCFKLASDRITVTKVSCFECDWETE
jgi:hypothetical protein